MRFGIDTAVLEFPFSTILRRPGERTTPKGDFSRPQLGELVIGDRSIAGASEGCCVGQAWSHREAAEGHVELGSRSCFLGML